MTKALIGERSGVDTVSLAWRGQGGTRLLSEIQAAPSFKSGRGLVLADTTASGARVMAWPEHGLVAIEGRLAASVDGDRGSYRLASRSDLRHCAEEAMRRQVLELLGEQPAGPAGEVRRFDLASEREFAAPNEGQAFLRAVSLLVPAGYKRKSFVAPDGRVETTYVVTAKRGRAVARAYDKGVESGTHAPGERVRLEAQNRPTKGARMTAEQLAMSDWRGPFGRTVGPFLGAEELTVTTTDGLVGVVAQRAASGEMSMARAERALGSAMLLREFGRGIYPDDRQARRRLGELRKLGVVVDDEMPAAAVPVSQLLREMVEEFSA